MRLLSPSGSRLRLRRAPTALSPTRPCSMALTRISPLRCPRRSNLWLILPMERPHPHRHKGKTDDASTTCTFTGSGFGSLRPAGAGTAAGRTSSRSVTTSPHGRWQPAKLLFRDARHVVEEPRFGQVAEYHPRPAEEDGRHLREEPAGAD